VSLPIRAPSEKLINAQDIERAGFPWRYIDNIEPRDLEANRAIIVNTDREDGPGVHWIAIIPLHNREVFIFDPLGANNSRVDSAGVPSMNELKLDLHRAKFRMYPYAVQMKSSTHCGWFSLYVAKMLQDHLIVHPKASARELNALIEDKFGRSADPADEREMRGGFSSM
jgi:hypothetical protein